jgi:hypothetical protein
VIVFCGQFLKNTEVAHIFGHYFPQVSLCIIHDKKVLGLHFGRFFTKSSGHPVEKLPKKYLNGFFEKPIAKLLRR